MILSDFDLKAYIESGRLKIEPFFNDTIRENGLDLRLGRGYCKLRPGEVVVVEEGKDVSHAYECGLSDDFIELEPGGRYLLHTLEVVALPPELMAFVELRSTFARLGLMMPPTIIDGGFEGQITIEVLAPPFHLKLPVMARFLHLVFAKLTTPVTKPYKGKYQGQRGVTPPILKGIT